MPSNKKDYQRAYNKSYKKDARAYRIYYSDEQYRELKADAAKLNISITRLIHLRSIDRKNGVLEAAKFLNPNDPLVKEFRFMLSNATNNINQIAHQSNLFSRVLDETEALQAIHNLHNKYLLFLKNHGE